MKSFALCSVVALLAAATGCGDGPICPSEVFVRITSPASGSTLSTANDGRASEAGIQVNVAVGSNVASGSTFTLRVVDAAGAVGEYFAMTDTEGNVSFADVTMPAGALTLTVTGTSDDCGSGEDSVTVNVVTEAECSLAIREGELETEFYAPIPVLNSTNDADAALPNFQANVDVSTAAGFTVRAFVLDVVSGQERAYDMVTADGSGEASFPITLEQGQHVVRATCVSGTVNEASATHTVFVDTVVPTCSISAPEEGVVVTPDFDTDENDANGIQFTWMASVDDGSADDTEGESTVFSRGGLQIPGTALDEGAAQTVDPAHFTSPGDFAVGFRSQDRADNPCIAGFDVAVILEGCAVEITAPLTTVTTDSDSNDTNGLQTDVVAQIGTDCEGQQASVDCGEGVVSVPVPTGGLTTLANVTLSTAAQSAGASTCTVSVTNSANFTTSDAASVAWDTEAPATQLQFVSPAGLACGDTIALDVSNDVDNNLSNGLQIAARVVSPFADEREIELTNGGACAGTCVLPEAGNPGSDISVTVEGGANNIVAVGRDEFDNEANSGDCNVTVADIAVAFSPPVNDGLLGPAEGTVNGTDISLTICGTVSEVAATVSLAVDGGAALPTTNTTGTWCTDAAVTLSEGTHQLLASAVQGARVGDVTQEVVVDLTPPSVPTSVVGSAPTRAELELAWQSPGGAQSYEIRYSASAFTDFFNQGTAVSGPAPGAVGANESVSIGQVTVERQYWMGIAAVDAAGNASAPVTVGPIRPVFDQALLAVPDANNGDRKNFGTEVVGGNFNNDAYQDLAISSAIKSTGASAAGEVYVYFGSATGIDTSTPDVTLQGSQAFAGFGFGLTAINWGGGAGDDLVVGTPYANGVNGNVEIFYDTQLAAGGTIASTSADATITVSQTSNFFSVGGLGWRLAAGNVDGAGGEDLIIGAPNAGNGAGAVVIVYGGSGADAVVLSDTAPTMDGAGAHYIINPESTANGTLFGNTVAYLGDMRAGDGPGDVGIGYFADNAANETVERAYVLRGRTSVPTDALAAIVFDDARDLEIQYTPVSVTANGFAAQMASISDQNSDGFRDLVITANRPAPGRMWIVPGGTTGIGANALALTPTGTTGFLTRIDGVAPHDTRFATAVANNAVLGNRADVNNDGLEDLVVTGGIDGNTDLFTWLGGAIPTGVVTSASAAATIDAPASFRNLRVDGQKHSLALSWLGDVNGDGLSDICWADYDTLDTTPQGNEGAAVVLWDDGI